MEKTESDSLLRINSWVLDVDRLELRCGDETRRIRPKDLLVLQCLVDNAPFVVPRALLLDAGWPRGFVDGAVLGNAISRLRQLLTRSSAEVIETVPRKGYRLTAAVERIRILADSSWNLGSPYRGLHSFIAEYAPVFFGRSADVSAILHGLEKQSDGGRGFMVLVGPSGTGKTSLILAGVIPALERMDEGSLAAKWYVVHCLPVVNRDSMASELLTKVASALHLDPTEQQTQTGAEPEVDTFLSLLPEDNRDHPLETRVLLVLDPLESLLSDPRVEQREGFFELLHELTRSGRYWVVAGIRSNFYQDLMNSPSLVAMKSPYGQYDVESPGAAHLGHIIRKPAQLAGLTFERHRTEGISLDDTLLAYAVNHPEVLPQLQFVLDELYAARTSDNVLTYYAYDKLGGLAQATGRRAEQVFLSLAQPVQKELPFVLSKLVSSSGLRDSRFSRRFPRMQDIATNRQRAELVDQFVSARLFVADRANGDAIVSVVHEAVFRHWWRARDVLELNQEVLVLAARLRAACSTWLENQRSPAYLLSSGPLQEAEKVFRDETAEVSAAEQEFVDVSRNMAMRHRRLRRFGVGTMVCLTLLATGLAATALIQRHHAEQEARHAEAVTSFVTGLFELADPVKTQAGETSAQQIVDMGARQLALQQDQPDDIRASLLQTIGKVYLSLGQFEAAKENFDSALKLQRSNTDRDGAAETLNALGKLSYQTNAYDEAETYYQSALAELDANNQSLSGLYAEILNNFGELTAARGDYDRALSIHRDALEMRRQLFGSDSSEVATSVQNIAGVYRRNGKLVLAEEYYRVAIELQERHLGPNHAEVGTARANLGLLLTELERPAEAESELLRALEIRKAVYGPDHSQTANSLHNLAALVFKQKDYVRAEPLLRESLTLHARIYGNDHISVAYSQNNLGTLLLETERPDEATALFAAAFETLQRLLGESHPNTALIEANLARGLLATGKPESANAHAEAAVAVLTEALPANHWRLAVVRGILASTLVALGDLERADSLLRKSRAALVASHGADSSVVSEIDARLADLAKRR